MFCHTATAVGLEVRACIHHSTLLAEPPAHCGAYTLICDSSALESLAGRARPFKPFYFHNVAFKERSEVNACTEDSSSSLINVFHSSEVQKKLSKGSTTKPWRQVHRAPSMTMRCDTDVDPRIHAVRAASLLLGRLPTKFFADPAGRCRCSH